MLNCDTCQRDTNEAMRRDMGCGLLARAFDPQTGKTDPLPRSVPFTEHVDDNEWCYGFAARLPEVQDVAEAMVDWSKGAGYMEDDPPQALRTAVKILDGAVQQFQADKTREAAKGAKR